MAKLAIIKRVARMEVGLFGDCKPLRDGVWEIKVDVGAGYRVYYAHVGNMVIMLTSGNNRGQTTVSHFKRTLSFSRGAGFFP